MATVTKKVSRKSTKSKAPRRKAAPKAAPAKKKAALRGESTAEPRRLSFADLLKKYEHVVKGSLQFNEDGPFAGKQSVKIKCAVTGCRVRREVATSDLFQVTMCKPHTLEGRRARRAESRKAKSA